uniref:ANK_REP_REGION domain-containing protein n=1 Tax=Rhabditophanes sp. KR3021 TaxID=114890 RepID=A0AC35U2F9_9BILA
MGNSSTKINSNDNPLTSHHTKNGKGELVKWMQYAMISGDHSIVDSYIQSKLVRFMYNGGKGRVEPIATLIRKRNAERNAVVGTLRRKKGRGKSGPNILQHIDQENDSANEGDLQKALKILEGGNKKKGDNKYREMCWKLDERGAQGETMLGLCLQKGTSAHTQIATKMVQMFPKLVNDIFISEAYYGLSPLHQAIVSEDPVMVRFFIRQGADIHQRCYGEFFTPDDQKYSRQDSVEHEWVELTTETNYEGKMYFGEYPLSFAACSSQEYAYRLLRSKKADPHLRDTNGNTALHMTVIHGNLEMLRVCYQTGSRLSIQNNQRLTPLTLAVKMSKKAVFDELLRLERDVVWIYGESNSYAYPLANIDTIEEVTGMINTYSALSLVVHGETQASVVFMNGLLEKILEAKWKGFAKRRLIVSFVAFVVYYIFFTAAFMTRPISYTTSVLTKDAISSNGTFNPLLNSSNWVPDPKSWLDLFREGKPIGGEDGLDWNDITGKDYFGAPPCHLVRYDTPKAEEKVRLVCEIAVLVMVCTQIGMEIVIMRQLTIRRWWSIIKSFPAKICFKLSWIMILCMIPARLGCGIANKMLLVDNMLSIASVIMTSVHFLYYCRSVKFIGTSILAIYRIFAQDMFRFIMIYCIFLVGFSQAFFIVFLSCEREEKRLQKLEIKNESLPKADEDKFDNIMEDPLEGLIRIFIATINEFSTFYRQLQLCPNSFISTIGKIIFLIYELFVSLMQFNLLIAMLTRTYEAISNTQEEYKRQKAKVILLVESTLSPRQRLMEMLKYSRPIGTDKNKRAFILSNSQISEDNELWLKEQKNIAMANERQLIDELKEKVKQFGLPKKYHTVNETTIQDYESKNVTKQNTFPRMRYIYAFPEEIASMYFGNNISNSWISESKDFYEKKETIQSVSSNGNSKRYKKFAGFSPVSPINSEWAAIDNSNRKPLNISVTSSDRYNNNPYKNDSPYSGVTLSSKLMETPNFSPKEKMIPIKSILSSPSNKSGISQDSVRFKSPLVNFKAATIDSPYLKTLESSLHDHFNDIEKVTIEELHANNGAVDSECSQHLWEKILCFSDGRKKVFVKIENRMMINKDGESFFEVGNVGGNKTFDMDTIEFIYNKIDKKINLTWLDLYTVKTWNYSIIIPLEKKFLKASSSDGSKDQERALRMLTDINEKYLIYQEILQRISIEHYDYLAQKAWLIMKGEAYRFHANIILDKKEAENLYQMAINEHKKLLNIIKDDMFDDIGNVWRALRYSMALIREARRHDEDFKVVLMYYINKFSEPNTFKKLCKCDQDRVIKYKEILENNEYFAQ